jgi:hypothetical protein
MKKRQGVSLKSVLNAITKRPLRKSKLNPKGKFSWNWKSKKESH